MPTQNKIVSIAVPDERLEEIEIYWRRSGLKNRSQGMLELMRKGIEAVSMRYEDSSAESAAVTDTRESLMLERFNQLDDTDKVNLYRIAGTLLEQDKYHNN